MQDSAIQLDMPQSPAFDAQLTSLLNQNPAQQLNLGLWADRQRLGARNADRNLTIDFENGLLQCPSGIGEVAQREQIFRGFRREFPQHMLLTCGQGHGILQVNVRVVVGRKGSACQIQVSPHVDLDSTCLKPGACLGSQTQFALQGQVLLQHQRSGAGQFQPLRGHAQGVLERQGSVLLKSNGGHLAKLERVQGGIRCPSHPELPSFRKGG